jgi:hypothetical protein
MAVISQVPDVISKDWIVTTTFIPETCIHYNKYRERMLK